MFSLNIYHINIGSGIFSNGNILQSWYNQARIEKEYLFMADVNGNNGGPSPDLPKFTGYKKLTSKPGAMCVNKMEWEYNKIEVGKDYQGSVHCGDFTCNVQFKVNKLDSNARDYWFLYTDTGYYIVPDGNNIYYYEQFCSFYKCYLTSGCLSSSEQSKDDIGGTIFDYIIISGSFNDDSVRFVTVTDGIGNVYKDINTKFNINNENNGNTTAKGMNLNDNIIGVSLMGRNYNLDGKYN